MKMACPQEKKIKEFLELFKSWFAIEPRITSKGIIIILRDEVLVDKNKYFRIDEEAMKLGAKRLIHPDMGFQIPIEQIVNTPAFLNNQTKDATTKTPTSFDIPAFHIDRLRTYYLMTKDELTESAFFLLSKGWTEKQFSEIGIARATFFRYIADYKKSQGKTDESHKETDSQDSNPSPNTVS